MSGLPPADRDTLLDLVAERAGCGLDAQAERDLHRLQASFPDTDVAGLELTAAITDLALVPATRWQPMPAAVRARVLAQAAQHFGAPARPLPPPTPARGGGRRPRLVRSPMPGWLVAAAALVLLVWEFATRPSPRLAPAAALAELRRTATDLVVLPWSRGADPTASACSGEVYWSNAQQRGFLTLRGLSVNDPRAAQYQLWIFDQNQSDKTPVDGGVFDVTGDVVVPITARLRVVAPSLFAVTVEKPGGVVVSSRERLALLAKVQ